MGEATVLKVLQRRRFVLRARGVRWSPDTSIWQRVELGPVIDTVAEEYFAGQGSIVELWVKHATPRILQSIVAGMTVIERIELRPFLSMTEKYVSENVATNDRGDTEWKHQLIIRNVSVTGYEVLLNPKFDFGDNDWTAVYSRGFVTRWEKLTPWQRFKMDKTWHRFGHLFEYFWK